VLTPASVIPDDQAWFWTPEWRAKEREVDEALAEGERGDAYDNGESLLRALADDAGPTHRLAPHRQPQDFHASLKQRPTESGGGASAQGAAPGEGGKWSLRAGVSGCRCPPC
jgi:hypothetical protein